MNIPHSLSHAATLNRRRFLRNIALGASAPILGPLLGRLKAYAGGGVLPKRFVFIVQGNGIKPETIAPAAANRPTKVLSRKNITNAPVFRELSLKSLAMSPDFETLAPYQDRLTVLMGLSGRSCQGGHSNNFGALGVYGSTSGPAGETIDCALARTLPAPFPHVSLGIARGAPVMAYNISARGKGQAVPMQCRPVDAHQALFGSVLPNVQGDFATLPCVLDYMSGDLKRLEKSLAGPEREKIQAYTAAMEDMSRRQGTIRAKDPILRKLAPPVTPQFTSATETDQLEAQVEIGAAALIAGLTNTLVIGSANGDPYYEITYKGLGIAVNMHSIGHGLGEKDGRSGDELAGIIRRFHLGMMVRLADKLKAVPEGNGTMFDNTCIVFLSDAADGHHASNWEFPMVILGDLGGTLKTRGRYIEYPFYGNPGHRTIASLYSTFLHAAGAPRDNFGVIDPEIPSEMQTGPLQELLA